MLNEASLIGNVGRDPEIRHTKEGKPVANISVATSTGAGDKKRTEWHRIVLWDKSGDIAQSYIQKGTLVFIKGQIRTRKWTDQSGAERYSTEIHVGGYGSTIRVLKDGIEKGSAASSGNNTSIKSDSLEDDIPWDEPDL